jgi:hypothetical protein
MISPRTGLDEARVYRARGGLSGATSDRRQADSSPLTSHAHHELLQAGVFPAPSLSSPQGPYLRARKTKFANYPIPPLFFVGQELCSVGVALLGRDERTPLQGVIETHAVQRFRLFRLRQRTLAPTPARGWMRRPLYRMFARGSRRQGSIGEMPP